MRRTSGQQMLDWDAVRPARAVGIELPEPDRAQGGDRGTVRTTAVGGRLAEHTDPQRVADDPTRRVAGRSEAHSDGDGVATGAVRTPRHRFHLDRLSRELVVEEIITINPTASVAFLNGFADDGLRLYLGRLRSAQLGRGRASLADRPAGPAVTCAHMRKL